MSVEIKRSPHYRKNVRRCQGDDTPCYICGKPIKGEWDHVIHVGEGGVLAVTEEEAKSDPMGDMGCFPVGSGCWQLHPELHQYGG